MSWFRLDDKSWSHAKVVQAGNAAWGALCRMGAYASDHLTDGVVPASIAQLIATIEETERLIAVGLLTREDDGCYRIHDYLRYNPKARDVKKKRDEISHARSEAGRIGGKKSARSREATAKQDPKQEVKQTPKQTPEPLLKQNEAPDPVPIPSRPDPKSKEEPKIPDAKPSGSDPARRVFRYYAEQRAFHLGAKATVQVTDKRLRLIRERLKEGFTEQDLLRAVDGIFATPWNMGENDRHTKYVEPEHVFREAKQVERHRATAEERAPRGPATVAAPREVVTDPVEIDRLRSQAIANLDAIKRKQAPFLVDDDDAKPTTAEARS